MYTLLNTSRFEQSLESSKQITLPLSHITCIHRAKEKLQKEWLDIKNDSNDLKSYKNIPHHLSKVELIIVFSVPIHILLQTSGSTLNVYIKASIVFTTRLVYLPMMFT